MAKLKCVSSECYDGFIVGKEYKGDYLDKNSPIVTDDYGDSYYLEPCLVGWAVCAFDVTFIEIGE